jgi:transcriptional regulator with XRE-family HTH domain
VGERIRARRIALGWSQEQFARYLGLHRHYVSALERGRIGLDQVSPEAWAQASVADATEGQSTPEAR